MRALFDQVRAIVRNIRDNIFARDARDAALDDELNAYVEQLTDRYERDGLSRDDARRAALLATGGVTQVKEATRDAWLGRHFHAFSRELRYAIRALRRSPAFVIIAVVTLGVGVGGATAIVSVISAVLLQPLPGVAKPEELFSTERVMAKGDLDDASYADYLDFRDKSTTTAGLAAYNGTSITIDHPRSGKTHVWISYVSGNFFSVLGVRAYAGHLFDPGEVGRYASAPVVVIGYQLWKTRFAGDSNVVGSTMQIAGKPVTIVGIAPDGFVGTMRLHPMEVWIPFVAFHQLGNSPDDQLYDRGYSDMRLIGRRVPTATLADVSRDLSALSDQFAKAYPEDRYKGIRVFEGVGMTDGERVDIKRTPRMLSIAMLMLLLIACANVAGLTLVRASAKRRELATRIALGASRASLVRQLAIEGTIIALLSGLAGIAMAQVLIRTAAIMKTIVWIRGVEYMLDWTTLGSAFALTTAVALLVSIVPAFQVSRTDIGILMKDGAGGVVRSRPRAQRVLVVGQVAASLMLLAAASVLFGAFQRTLRINPGFDANGLKHVYVRLNQFDTAVTRQFTEQLVQRTRGDARFGPIALASISLPAPWAGLNRVFRNEEAPAQLSLNDPAFVGGSRAYIDAISDKFFEVLRVPMLVGRDFTPDEVASSAPVAIISHRLAEELWPRQNPVGRLISWPTKRGPERPPFRVVGVVADVHFSTLAGGPSPVVYIANSQRLQLWPQLIFRDHGGVQVAAMRALLTSMKADLEYDDIAGASLVDDGMQQQRVVSAWVGIFGLIALFLAAIGVYGVIAQSVYQRTRELAVRAAVGARPGELLRLILSDGIRLGGAGVIVGTIGVVFTFRILRALFDTMQTIDLSASVVAIVALAAAILLASLIPARRAAALNPVDALRSD
ncbi:MAG TPA: ADOP family duplicated permease [Gemmatimonadaceae bacterium]|jgi:predicted permease